MTTRILFLAAFVLLTACANAPEVETSVASGGDPSKYRTFAFAQGEPNAKGTITEKAVHDRIRYMIAEQLVSRGYVPAPPGQAAELGVHFTSHVEAKQQAIVVGRPGPYTYDAAGVEFGGYRTQDYRQGTLFVDLFHVGDQRLLWRAQVSEALVAGYSEENWTKMGNALTAAFKSLPPRR